jgi:hypothetical protein
MLEEGGLRVKLCQQQIWPQSSHHYRKEVSRVRLESFWEGEGWWGSGPGELIEQNQQGTIYPCAFVNSFLFILQWAIESFSPVGQLACLSSLSAL